MLVEFSVIPIGKGSSISSTVARVLKIVDSSGLPYKVNPMGTVVEGDWNTLMNLIKECHESARKGRERVITLISIDDRKGKTRRIEAKVKSVERKLHKRLKK